MNAVLHGCKVAKVLRYVVRYDVCVTRWYIECDGMACKGDE